MSNLIMPGSADWNAELIKLHLPQYEDHIMKLTPSALEMDDEHVWLFDKSGNYTTKSGYAIAKRSTCNHTDQFNWNKCVWNVKTSPKLKHFLWKLKSNALGVGENLLKRGMQVDGRCERCGAMESVHHVMIACPFAQRVWSLAQMVKTPSTTSSMGEALTACERLTNLPPPPQVFSLPYTLGYSGCCGLVGINCCSKISLS